MGQKQATRTVLLCVVGFLPACRATSQTGSRLQYSPNSWPAQMAGRSLQVVSDDYALYANDAGGAELLASWLDSQIVEFHKQFEDTNRAAGVVVAIEPVEEPIVDTAVETEPVEEPVVDTTVEPLAVEREAGEGEVAVETATEPTIDPIDALIAELEAALVDALAPSIESASSTLVDFGEPNGNGVAFAKFLAIYEGLNTASEPDAPESGELVDTEA